MQRMQIEPSRWSLPVVLAVTVALALGACAGADAPEVPEDASGVADPVLVVGRDVWVQQCSRCHGGDGSGGAGPRVQGPWPADREPDAAAMAELVVGGRGAMPGFGRSLSDDEVEAVVRYVREVL
jgi:mono/diheme cytochrome c family protein